MNLRELLAPQLEQLVELLLAELHRKLQERLQQLIDQNKRP